MKYMKNMKKFSTAVIAAALTVSAFALPVHAEENTTSASTEFSYVQKNEPTYTVSIPSAPFQRREQLLILKRKMSLIWTERK